MEENFKQNQQPTMQEPKKQEQKKKEPSAKKKEKKAKVAVITLSTIVVLFLGLQVYASTNGYGNVFFMIKNLITTGNPAGEQEIFSDKDITLSYKSIEVAEGLKIQANRLEIKDGKTKIYLSIKSESYNHLPLKYDISTTDNTGKLIKDKTRSMGIAPENDDDISYQEVITLDYEVGDNDIIIIKIIDVMDKELRTLEINLQTREITIKGEKDFEKVSEIELKKYLSAFSLLNDKSNYTVSDNLIEIATKIQAIDNSKIVLKRETINEIAKQIYGENAKFETKKDSQGKDVEVLKDMRVGTYETLDDTYDLMEHDREGKCLKIEDINYENEIYTVKYVYLIATGEEASEDKLEDLPQYETTIKLKRNENNTYSKYEIVSLEKGTEIKNKVNADVNENTEADFFEKNANIQYYEDLTNPENGKAAIIKSGEEILKTTQNNGYYTYTDMWNNSYNIKKIKDVKSEFTQLGKDKQSALYKCTIYYIDNNNQDKSFDAAVVLAKDAEGGIIGTYDNYTGSTRYTRWSGLYNENEEENKTETPTNNTNTSTSTEKVDNYVHYFNWVKYTAPGLKFEYPTELKLENTGMQNKGELSTTITGTLVGRDVDTNQPIYSNIKIKVFNPMIVDEKIMNNLKYNPENGLERANMTTNKGLKWYESKGQSDEAGYSEVETYSNFNQTSNGVWEMRQIEFVTDNRNNFKITNLINYIIGSTELANW